MLQLFLLKCQIVFNHMCQVAPHEDGCLANHSDVCFSSDHNKLGDVETLVLAVLLTVLLASDLCFSLHYERLNISPINHVMGSIRLLPGVWLSGGVRVGDHILVQVLLILRYKNHSGHLRNIL